MDIDFEPNALHIDHGPTSDARIDIAFYAGHAAADRPGYTPAPYSHPELCDAYDAGFESRRESQHWACHG